MQTSERSDTSHFQLAEEGGAGKVKLIDAGGYKEMDICLMCHPGPGPKNTTGTGPSLALVGIEVEFFGHT